MVAALATAVGTSVPSMTPTSPTTARELTIVAVKRDRAAACRGLFSSWARRCLCSGVSPPLSTLIVETLRAGEEREHKDQLQRHRAERPTQINGRWTRIRPRLAMSRQARRPR